MAKADAKKGSTVIMVSSIVYGYEEMLNQVYGALNSYGYRVWMSHAGTIPVDPGKSNFQNLIKAGYLRRAGSGPATRYVRTVKEIE